jgi:hypothetical protein
VYKAIRERAKRQKSQTASIQGIKTNECTTLIDV